MPTGIKGLYFRGGSGSKNTGLALLILMLLAGAGLLVYYLIVAIARSLIFLYFWIFKEDHIAYINLIIFLGVLLGVVMTVYFMLPARGVLTK